MLYMTLFVILVFWALYWLCFVISCIYVRMVLFQTVGSITTFPYSCEFCHKQYANKSKLISHKRDKHGHLPTISATADTLDQDLVDTSVPSTNLAGQDMLALLQVSLYPSTIICYRFSILLLLFLYYYFCYYYIIYSLAKLYLTVLVYM